MVLFLKMRSGLWRELKENAVVSYRNDSGGRTPTTLLDSFIDEMFYGLRFLLVLCSSR